RWRTRSPIWIPAPDRRRLVGAVSAGSDVHPHEPRQKSGPAKNGSAKHERRRQSRRRASGGNGLAPAQETRANQTEADHEQGERLGGGCKGASAGASGRAAGAANRDATDDGMMAPAATKRQRRRGGQSQHEAEHSNQCDAHRGVNLLSMVGLILKARAEAL